ncbi:hypothetical protein QD460_34450, partial [Rhizobium jaguaris]|uniref:hypothetical protein n=1 Tax=Rhizobium jaguaris TaxID=1312183 RepID=UPI0039BF85EF
LLFPEPFGPAMIRKTGCSIFDGSTIKDASYSLVLATRLGDILAEHVAQIFSERLALRVDRPNSQKLPGTCVTHAFLRDRGIAYADFGTSKFFDDDFGHVCSNLSANIAIIFPPEKSLLAFDWRVCEPCYESERLHVEGEAAESHCEIYQAWAATVMSLCLVIRGSRGASMGHV